MVPPATHPCFRALLFDEKQLTLSCLGLKILVGRTRLSIKSDSSSSNLERQIGSLHEFLVKNEQIARDDIQRIMASY